MFSVKSHNSKATTDNSEGRASFRVTTLIATVLRDRGVHFVLVVLLLTILIENRGRNCLRVGYVPNFSCSVLNGMGKKLSSYLLC